MMKNVLHYNLLKWLGYTLWLFAVPLSAQETLESFLNELHTLHATFKQKLYNEQGKLLETAQGELFIQRPQQFRWDYQQPYQQLIVADGEKIWVYDADLEQVTVKDLDSALGKTPALLLSSGRPVEADFFVTPLPTQTAELKRFELIPKDAQAQFESIRLTLQNNKLQGFELTDNLGQTTFITFAHSQYNQKLDEGLFIFTPPAGADVIMDDQ
ncbi:MAG: outer membrane lipoprotein chaperone LolA [Pseudomonadota bacterium]|nr:outer membrane lipoprotein chaperone LolA [Pseudomonadota bacterium]